MSGTQQALLVIGMAAVTFLVRWPVLALISRMALPQAVLDAMKYIPPAVLTAIVVPAMLAPAGQLDISFSNAYLIAGVVAALIAWRTRNLLLTIVLGMTLFLVWSYLL
jgi:branched-subunit amino acid transport protein